MFAQLTDIDVLILTAYFALVGLSAWWFGLRKTPHSNMSVLFKSLSTLPFWAVAMSILATSQSAATFLGGPDQGYRGDFSYLATTISVFIAAWLVARYLIPTFFRYRVTTVYQLLTQRFGQRATSAAGLMYLFGRLFASGARLYMAAIAVSMVLFGDIAASHIFIAIVVIVISASVYAVWGGIRAVILSDVLQCLVYFSAALIVGFFLLSQIPLSLSEIIALLVNEPAPSTGTALPDLGKLSVIYLSWDVSASGVFHLASLLTGLVLLNIAAFGLDQDLTQRLLSCDSSAQATRALYWSIGILVPVLLVFIGLGFLLYIVYQKPEVMQHSLTLTGPPEFAGQTVTVLLHYVLTMIPAGFKALVIIGIIAAALSSLNSGLNSMASVVVEDFIKPSQLYTRLRVSEIHLGRYVMLVIGLCLSAMAMLCFYWQQHTDMPLLQFALSVMVFSYSGLLGVFFTALFTQRGSNKSVSWALLVGFAVPLLCQPYCLDLGLGFTWQLCLGTLCATLVCMLGKSQTNATHPALSTP